MLSALDEAYLLYIAAAAGGSGNSNVYWRTSFYNSYGELTSITNRPRESHSWTEVNWQATHTEIIYVDGSRATQLIKELPGKKEFF